MYTHIVFLKHLEYFLRNKDFLRTSLRICQKSLRILICWYQKMIFGTPNQLLVPKNDFRYLTIYFWITIMNVWYQRSSFGTQSRYLVPPN